MLRSIYHLEYSIWSTFLTKTNDRKQLSQLLDNNSQHITQRFVMEAIRKEQKQILESDINVTPRLPLSSAVIASIVQCNS